VALQLAKKVSGHDIADIAKNWIDNEIPVILGLVGKNFAHWVVAVGYIEDENKVISDILTLDPGSESPKYALWNGILSLNKEPRKRYGFRYDSDYNQMVDLDEAIIITKK
jgi:hypothetical protein